MADIFISYSQKDRARVKRLVDALSAEGYNVWWDLDIRAGESFDQLIEATLKRVRCVVAVWSRQSVKSEWVRAESAWAKDRNKLVSIRIDEDLELPLKFYHVHTKSMTRWEGTRDASAFQELRGPGPGGELLSSGPYRLPQRCSSVDSTSSSPRKSLPPTASRRRPFPSKVKASLPEAKVSRRPSRNKARARPRP